MRLTVRYFAAFREAAGTAGESLETRAGTPDELFAECASRHAALTRFTASRVAVNDELADWVTPLKDGDEVLFFPPVAGG
jgi:molybdopterin converting factor subunit 1